MTIRSKTYNYVINKDKIDTINSVIVTLETLNSHLDNTELDTIKFFNHVYVFVAKELESTILSGVFSHSHLVEQLNITFALYYFEGLNHYVTHKQLPKPWNTVMQKNILNPLYFLLGANVHINHDLPLAILDSVPDLEEFEKDFNSIDNVVGKAIKKFFQTQKPRSSFTFMQYFLTCIVREPATFIILRWRHKAWLQAKLLAAKKITKSDLALRTIKISKKLTGCGKILHRMRVVFAPFSQQE